MKKNKTINIKVPMLARVEGEGALDLTIKDQQIEALKLHIYEPPRLFEKFLQQREYMEVLDIVARICGICPVAYQMSAVTALEQILNIQPSPWINSMRRLFYCGEWIQSHSLHIHILAAPDFLGFNSIAQMAKDYPNEAKRGMELQQMGNAIIALFGGRSVHPVGARVGGFYKSPDKAKANELLQQLKTHVKQAKELVHWTASLAVPDIENKFTCVALHHPKEYAMIHGDIISSDGLQVTKEDFEKHFHEFQVPHSTALHSLLNENTYLVGPLARVNLNHQQFPVQVKKVMQQLNIQWPSFNMFHSIVARALEVYFAFVEAISILENYLESEQFAITPEKIQSGIGFGATEAPRGLLWQSYQMNDKGVIEKAKIIPPTSQNQARIEEDIKISLETAGLAKSDKELRLLSETIIRNYDPCISCSTHFLDLRVKRQ